MGTVLRRVSGLPGLPVALLVHNYHDDSRTVEDLEGNALLTFDSSLGVHMDGEQIGRMQSSGSNWAYVPFLPGPVFDTGIAVHDHHWTNLELAEVAVAEYIMKG